MCGNRRGRLQGKNGGICVMMSNSNFLHPFGSKRTSSSGRSVPFTQIQSWSRVASFYHIISDTTKFWVIILWIMRVKKFLIINLFKSDVTIRHYLYYSGKRKEPLIVLLYEKE
jgi:hypothetical protein